MAKPLDEAPAPEFVAPEPDLVAPASEFVLSLDDLMGPVRPRSTTPVAAVSEPRTVHSHRARKQQGPSKWVWIGIGGGFLVGLILLILLIIFGR